MTNETQMTNETHTDPYAPCHCGSGKKYKFCCLAQDREASRKTAATTPAPDAPEPDAADASVTPSGEPRSAPPAARRTHGAPDAGSRFHGRGAPRQASIRTVLAGQRIRGSQRAGGGS